MGQRVSMPRGLLNNKSFSTNRSMTIGTTPHIINRSFAVKGFFNFPSLGPGGELLGGELLEANIPQTHLERE